MSQRSCRGWCSAVESTLRIPTPHDPHDDFSLLVLLSDHLDLAKELWRLGFCGDLHDVLLGQHAAAVVGAEEEREERRARRVRAEAHEVLHLSWDSAWFLTEDFFETPQK